MKYQVKFTTRFKKDIKLAKKQGKNIDALMDVVNKLAEGEYLPEKQITGITEELPSLRKEIPMQAILQNMTDFDKQALSLYCL